MITEIKLSSKDRNQLGERISQSTYKGDALIEISSIHHYTNHDKTQFYRVHYSFEDMKGKLCSDSIDLEEIY